MRVQTVRMVSRGALLLAGVWMACRAPTSGSAGSGGLLTMAVFDYAALTLLAQAAFPRIRRSDLAKAVMAFVAALEGLRAVTIWHGDATVLLQSLAAVAAAYAVSFIERFRSGVRQEPGSTFTLSHARERRGAGQRRSRASVKSAASDVSYSPEAAVAAP